MAIPAIVGVLLPQLIEILTPVVKDALKGDAVPEEQAAPVAEQAVKDALGQLDLAMLDAQSESFFRSGWRPLMGWVCGFGLGYEVMGRPLLSWVGELVGMSAQMPVLSWEILATLVAALLGVSLPKARR
jgi:hypothetical protein